MRGTSSSARSGRSRWRAGLTHSCRSFHAGVGGPRTFFSTTTATISVLGATGAATPAAAVAITNPGTLSNSSSPPAARTQHNLTSFSAPAATTTIIRPRLPAAFIAWRSRRFYSTATRMPPNASEWPAARVRKSFFDFFHERGHTVGESEYPAIASCITSSITTNRTIALRFWRFCDPFCHRCYFLHPQFCAPFTMAPLTHSLQSPRALSSRTMTPPCSSPTRG